MTVRFDSYGPRNQLLKARAEDNGSGYKSTCANEEAIDETGSPRKRELAYELSAKGFGLSGLGWAGSGLGWCLPVDLARLSRDHTGPSAWCRAWVLAWFAPFVEAVAGRKRERRRKEEERERKGKEEKKEERDLGEEEKKREKEEKNLGARVFGDQNPII